ncbi:MAG TPA: serine/threonine-protein kinase [Thermoanaerobaculia bacterium]|nr:serine/threonine-protein kinase [Thermoanaerobaculia bacterium]
MTGFGRYRVLGEVGRGGMGVVYRAHDPELDREVAVKHIQLAPDASREVRDELEMRFRREAKAAARIRHPGVVAIHDVGTTETGLYLVMELVDGESLGRRLERGVFPDRAAALEVAARAAEALAAAHRAGVVHRDVKPANILISRDGRVLLTDFGVARSLDEVSELTRTGMVVGSPAYMAPEQLRGDAVDGRADLFSLGVVLYEMLLRKRPFPAQSITTLLYQILHEDPLADPAISRELDVATAEVLRRLLAKEAAERYGDAAVVAVALRELPLEAPTADQALTRPRMAAPVLPAAPPPAAAPPAPPRIPPTAPAATPPPATPPRAVPAAAAVPPITPAYAAPPAAYVPPPPAAATGAQNRTLLLVALGMVAVALVVIAAAVALWNRNPGRPIVQPPRPEGWTPADGPLPETSVPLPDAAPTMAPLPMILPPAGPTPTLDVGALEPPPPPVAPRASPAASATAAAPMEAPPVPSAPPVATQPPPPSAPREEVSQHLRCRRGVEFDVSPGDAQVYLDGRLLGTADEVEQYELASQPGRHLLRFTAAGYKPVTVEVEVGANGPRWSEVEVEMEELPEAESDGGR